VFGLPTTAQRLMFNRARMSGIHLPVVATQPKAPIIEVQTASVARPSDWARAIEKLSSTQKALKGRLAAETSSQRVSADKVLASRPIALRERPAANKASGWATAIDKLRSKQTALERVARVKTTNGAAITDRATQFDRIWDGPRLDTPAGEAPPLPASLVRPKPQQL